MHVVVIRLPVADLSKKFAAMRSWLDQNSCTPRRFTSNRDDGMVSVHVEFMNPTDAERFGEEFDGAKGPKTHRISAPLRKPVDVGVYG
jgi:hypothetical protein